MASRKFNVLKLTGVLLCIVISLTSIVYADLSEYPKQLTSSSGDFEGEIVFSNADDALAASGVLSGLEATESGEATRSPTYKHKDIAIGVDLNNSAAFGDSGLDYSTIKSLWDGEVTIDTNDFKKAYDTHEEILLRGLSVETGLSFLGYEDEKFKERVFLTVPKSGIKYYYKFDDVLDSNNYLTSATVSDPIFLPMLGRTLRIIGATTNSITVSSGEFSTLSVGQTVEYQGHKITLLGADANSATFKVDEEEIWVTELYSKDVSDIDIYLEKVHDLQDSPSDLVEIWVSGSKSKAIYKDDDPFIGEPTVGTRWRWEIGSLNTAYPSINASWSLIADEADEVFYEGQPIRLINSEFDWLEIVPTKVLRDRRRTYKMSASTEDLHWTDNDNADPAFTSQKVIHFDCEQCSSNDAFKTTNNNYADDMYIADPYACSLTKLTMYQVYYKDPRSGHLILDKNVTCGVGDFQKVEWATAFSMEHLDTSLNVNASSQCNAALRNIFNITFKEHGGSFSGDGRELWLYTIADSSTLSLNFLGHSDGDTAIEHDWRYDSVPQTGKDISGWEENTRTDAGIVLQAPKDTDAEDVYYIEVPEAIDDFKARVAIKGSGARIKTGVVIKGVKSSSVIGSAEKASKATKNLVLVGGPCVNELSAEALKLTFPACGEASGLKEGEAKIHLVENAFADGKNAILVYGWSAEDTKRAAEYLAKYWEQASFKGNEIIVA